MNESRCRSHVVKYLRLEPYKDAFNILKLKRTDQVEGTNPEGDRVLILWRNLDETDNDTLDKWFTKPDYNTKEQVYEIFYVNGDSNIENLRRPDQTLKVRLIEEGSQRLMFDVEDV